MAATTLAACASFRAVGGPFRNRRPPRRLFLLIFGFTAAEILSIHGTSAFSFPPRRLCLHLHGPAAKQSPSGIMAGESQDTIFQKCLPRQMTTVMVNAETSDEANPAITISASCPLRGATSNGTKQLATALFASSSSAEPPKLIPKKHSLLFLRSSFKGQAHKYLTKLMNKHGENFMILDKYVVLNDPSCIRDVLITHNLEKTEEVKRGYRSLFGGDGGILAASWETWVPQRKLVRPALTAEGVIESFAPKFEEGSRPFFDFLESAAATGRRIEMDGAFIAVTMDIIGLVLMGRSFGMVEKLAGGEKGDVAFVEALENLIAEAARQTANPDLLVSKTTKSRKGRKTADRLRRVKRRLRRRRHLRKAKKTVDDFLEGCIHAKLVQIAKDGIKPNIDEGREPRDLLDILLAAECEGIVTRDEVKGQLLTFIFAGHDTLGHTLGWLLWEVSQNPALQDDLSAEVREALPGRENFHPEGRLDLLERVFKETLRKHPAAANGTVRSVGPKPLVVGGNLLLPPKTSVLIPPYSLHRNERYWPDPELFDPSRFTEEEIAKRDAMAFQAFSGGPRNCIGSRLANAEALALLGPLFRRFEVAYVGNEDGKEPADHCGLVRQPRDGLWFVFRRRN